MSFFGQTKQKDDNMAVGLQHQAYHLKQILGDAGFDIRAQPLTAERWVKFLHHYLQPYDTAEHLGTAFPYEDSSKAEEHSVVIQTQIPYNAVCAHHLLPVIGHASVGYIPKDRVVGLSKLTRLVHGVTHRHPSLQEEVGSEIADALMEHLGALGSAVIITAIHGCMACRGVEVRNVNTVTSTLRGVFFTEPSLRMELMTIHGQTH